MHIYICIILKGFTKVNPAYMTLSCTVSDNPGYADMHNFLTTISQIQHAMPFY